MNRYPLQVRARLDAPLNRWLWLVKWLLLIPHFIVLAVLWVAFIVVTLIAYVAVLFTGRYPSTLFAFNVGVLRWSWRVNYYGYQALGTDRYPPFTLAEVPDYPAGLTVDQPPRVPRWLPLVAWLLALPHLMIVAALTSGVWQPFGADRTTAAIGVVGVGVLIVGISLLFTGRYPRGLYDLLVGIARWALRVVAYVALLTGQYPPFRLDQGGSEPDVPPIGPTDREALAPTARSAPAAVPAGTVPAVAGGPPGARSSIAGRVVALVAGVLLLLVGVGAGIGGFAALAIDSNRAADGYVTSRSLDLSSPTAAITAEDIRLHLGDLWDRNLSDLGGVRITATRTSGTPLFLGVAAQSDVDRWLAGTAHDQLTAVTAGRHARYDRAAGSMTDIVAPDQQTFWLAKASGTGTVVMNWKATNGDFAIVMVNADGTRGVNGVVKVATQVPDLTPLAIGLLIGSGLLILLAVALIYLGASGIGRRHAGPPPPPTAPAELPPPPPISRPDTPVSRSDTPVGTSTAGMGG
jgi:hypothetical protein